MPDYKESNVQGKSWQRCSQITFRNPYNQTPSASFEEEVVTLLGDRMIVEHPRMSPTSTAGGMQVAFDPAATFPLIDPQTGEPTGQVMSQADIYTALFSLYRQKSEARDQAEAAREQAEVARLTAEAERAAQAAQAAQAASAQQSSEPV